MCCFKEQIKGTTGQCFLVVAGALGPQLAAVSFDDAAGHGEAEAGTAPFEFDGATRMVGHFARLIEFSEDEIEGVGGDADTGILDSDLNGRFTIKPWMGVNRLAGDGDLAAIRGVFDRIHEQLATDHEQRFGIAIDFRQGREGVIESESEDTFVEGVG